MGLSCAACVIAHEVFSDVRSNSYNSFLTKPHDDVAICA